jgi:hypothetical protein
LIKNYLKYFLDRVTFIRGFSIFLNTYTNMKIKNPFMAKHWTLGKVFLVIWLVLTTGFVAYIGVTTVLGALENSETEMNDALQKGATFGQNNAITKILELSANCNTVSLFAGEGENRVEVGLVDSACSSAQLRSAREAAATQATTQAVVPQPVITPPVVQASPVRQPEPPVQMIEEEQLAPVVSVEEEVLNEVLE